LWEFSLEPISFGKYSKKSESIRIDPANYLYMVIG